MLAKNKTLNKFLLLLKRFKVGTLFEVYPLQSHKKPKAEILIIKTIKDIAK